MWVFVHTKNDKTYLVKNKREKITKEKKIKLHLHKIFYLVKMILIKMT